MWILWMCWLRIYFGRIVVKLDLLREAEGVDRDANGNSSMDILTLKGMS